MFRKTLLVSIIFMIFAFSKSELVVSRSTRGGDVVKTKAYCNKFTTTCSNCTYYGAVEVVEGGCKCPTSSYFMGTCTPDEQIGCQAKVYYTLSELITSGHRASTLGQVYSPFKPGKAKKRLVLGYSSFGSECNKLDDIFLWNTGASGTSGDWVSIRGEGRKLWDIGLGYLVEINTEDMVGQMIKVVPASGCVNITCVLVVFSGGDVSYPVDIQKLEIEETPAPVTSAPITSPTPPPESNACGQFTPRYEYILTFLVLALAVIMSG